MSTFKSAAYYIIKHIDSSDVHIATFYDVRGNYLSTVNLDKSEYGKNKIIRLDAMLDYNTMNKILLSSVIIDSDLLGNKFIKYCDKNGNVLAKFDYKSDVMTKEHIQGFSMNIGALSIFDKKRISNGEFTIVDNSNKGYYCTIC